MSIRYKIALLFAGLVTIILVISNVSIYLYSSKERENTFRKRLANRASSTANVYAAAKNNRFNVLRRMDTAAVASLYNKSVSIVDYNHTIQYAFSDQAGDSLFVSDTIIEKAKLEGRYYYEYQDKAAVAMHYTDTDDNFIIAVSAHDIDGQEYLSQLKKIQIIATLLAIALSFVAGILFAKSLVRPINMIMGEVNMITSSNLSRRIKINESNDELTKLAQTFNVLLDRLEASFLTQSQFISNASHELSTPLTSISTQLEIALQKERSPEEYKSSLSSVYEDVNDLQQLTKSLLDLAKTGSRGGIALTEVRLDEILFKAMADVQRQNQGFKTVFKEGLFPTDERSLTVLGIQDLLYIALKNILENACKYSANQEAIISAEFEKNRIVIRVFNKGDVIPPGDIENIFQPFFRVETVHHKPGFGLGLTLTKRILAFHKATIEVESATEKGTTFIITIPTILSRV